MKSKVPPGTLTLGEPHPSAYAAMRWVRTLDVQTLCVTQEALASCSLSGNRLAEICSETLRRVLHHEPVSDRYILGLAWYLRDNLTNNEPRKEADDQHV